MWNKAVFAVILKTGVFCVCLYHPAMKLANARLSHFANRRFDVGPAVARLLMSKRNPALSR